MDKRWTQPLPTGFSLLDATLGTGGLPRGHIVEIFGPPACGKTALALQCVAHLQHMGAVAAWIDAEHAFEPRFATQLGINLAELPVAEPESAEEAMEMARRLICSCAVDLVVIDSAAALVPRLELESGIPSGSRSLQSRVLASELRKVAWMAAKSGVCALFLNQVRIRPEGVAGELETSAGGPSLKLHAAVRISLAAHGRMVRFRVLKNRLGTAFLTGELEWRPGSGFFEQG